MPRAFAAVRSAAPWPAPVLKKEISSFYLTRVPFRDSKILLDLAGIFEYKTLRLELENSSAEGEKYFGNYWKGFESDPDLLEECIQWIILFRQYLKEGTLTDRSFRLIGLEIDSEALESAVSHVSYTDVALRPL